MSDDPGSKLPGTRVLGHEGAVLHAAVLSVCPLDPPGGVVAHLDPGLAGQIADLPGRAVAERLDVELRRQPEIPLPASREADVATDPRDPEGADVLPDEVLAHDVPGAVVLKQRIRIERPLLLRVARDRPVVELDRALLRDRALELSEPSRELGGVLGVEHLDPKGRVGRRLGESWAAEGEVLQREPERLGVGELAFQEVERRLQGGELVVLEIELGEEVGLGAHCV